MLLCCCRRLFLSPPAETTGGSAAIVDGASEVYIVCVFENRVCFFSKIGYVFFKYGMFFFKRVCFFSAFSQLLAAGGRGVAAPHPTHSSSSSSDRSHSPDANRVRRTGTVVMYV